MKPRFCIFLIAIFLTAAVQAQDNHDSSQPDDIYTFRVLVRIDAGDVTRQELMLAAGAMGELELGNGYRLEFTAPGLAPVGTESATIILRYRQQDKWLPVHTYRQPLRGRHDYTAGYLICRQQVTLVSPVGDSLPGC